MKHYKPTQKSVAESVWAVLYGMTYEYGRAVFNLLDWFGRKLEYLIDYSDFFAGSVWTYVVMTAWELLAK